MFYVGNSEINYNFFIGAPDRPCGSLIEWFFVQLVLNCCLFPVRCFKAFLSMMVIYYRDRRSGTSCFLFVNRFFEFVEGFLFFATFVNWIVGFFIAVIVDQCRDTMPVIFIFSLVMGIIHLCLSALVLCLGVTFTSVICCYLVNHGQLDDLGMIGASKQVIKNLEKKNIFRRTRRKRGCCLCNLSVAIC